MVQQAYIHRLALGRSAFEPPAHVDRARPDNSPAANDQPAVVADDTDHSPVVQAYDSRGNPQNPASRARARRIIRAYNEVLATVGVCARVESEGRDDPLDQAKGSSRKADQAIVNENEVGFWLSFADELLCMSTTTAFINLKRRIQTFDIYSGISLLDIFAVELSCQGILRVLFAGEFAHRAFCLLWASSDIFIELGRERLLNRFVTARQSKRRRRAITRTIHVGERLAKLTVFYVLYPIQLYAGLQRLHLLPLWPLLPNPFSTPLFRYIFPSLPLLRNGRSLLSWCTAFATCPATIFLGMQLFSAGMLSKSTTYALSTMPRPDNPDDASFRITQDEFFEGQERVLNRLKYQTSFRAEVRKDIASLKRTLIDINLQFRDIWRKYVLGKRPSVGFPDNMSDEAILTTDAVLEQLPEVRTFINSTHAPPPIVTTSSTTAIPNSPLLTPISSAEESDFNEANTSNVRIRARAGSTSTLHMDVEFTTTDQIGAPVHTSSFASSPHPRSSMEMTHAGPTPYPYHRVTALSLHAAESLSLHSMATLTALVRIPIETFYMRSIAHNFLSASQTSGWLIQHVYPSNTWFGAGLYVGWPLIIDYSGKILLCSVLEILTKLQVWQLSCRTAFWLGRHWYGWGKL